ncbi:hypothetical protein J132_09127 [Termitomyces sp. J132]|nr:hypothetical protein J132_09127 [Termitomyces sp. J132]
MIRQCVEDKLKDWITKIPAIEFAINSARSKTTGYSPFFLNTGHLSRPMIWNNARSTEFVGVRVFTQCLKLALIVAHHCILAARVKQTHNTNLCRQLTLFTKRDMVYISTKIFNYPKEFPKKFIPKYEGIYKIIKDYGNSSFQIAIFQKLKR